MSTIRHARRATFVVMLPAALQTDPSPKAGIDRHFVIATHGGVVRQWSMSDISSSSCAGIGIAISSAAAGAGAMAE